MPKQIVVSALQLPTLGMQATRLEYYLKKAKERGATLMLFGEYVLNHFFKDLSKMPLSMIDAQTNSHMDLLKRYADEYNITFVAPMVQIKHKKPYKTIVKISPKHTKSYHQQILIPYPHWNEKGFFANDIKPLREPLVFRHNGFKVMAIGGFEVHFDYFWDVARRKKIDLVLLPTASTFSSYNRWREIIKTRAFLNGCFILRANRLGEYMDKEVKWKFYGDTMLVSPEGEVEMVLEDKESMLVEEIFKSDVSQHRRAWGFERELRIRGELDG